MTKKIFCQKLVCILVIITLLFGVSIGCGTTAFAYDEPVLDAPAAAAMDHRAGTILYRKNENRVMQIGALSNIMVALVAADKGEMTETLTNRIKLVLDSGDKAAIDRIVKDTCGTKKLFIKEMNRKAKKLGCKKTRFVEVYGRGKTVTLGDKDDINESRANTSTITDVSKMIMAFLNDRDLGKIQTPDKKQDDISYCVITQGDGKKTGNCGVLFGERDESQFAVVSVGGASSDISRAEGVEMLLYVFDNYRTSHIFSKGKSTGKIKIKGGAKNYVKVYAKKDLYVNLPKEGEDSLLQTRSVVNGDVTAPVDKGTVVGRMEVLEAGEVTGTVPIVVGEDVLEGGPLSKIGISDSMLKSVGIVLGTLLAVFIVLRVRAMRIRKKRLARQKKKRQAEAMRIAMERREKKERGWPVD